MNPLATARALQLRTHQDLCLTPPDQELLDLVLTGPADPDHYAALALLDTQVASGQYEPTGFYGFSDLSKGHDGYVHWKGRHVEHYSFDDVGRERLAAQELVRRCQTLEALGFPVNGRTVLDRACYEAEPGTPWRLALTRYYGFFESSDGTVGAFYLTQPADPARTVVALGQVNGEPFRQYFAGGYEAFHGLEQQGLLALSAQPDHVAAVSRLGRLGFTPAALDDWLQTP